MKRILCFLLVSFCVEFASGSPAESLVVPNGYQDAPGEASNLPFAGNGLRYQTVYAADQFLAAMPQGGFLTEIALRIDESDRRSYEGSIPNLEVRLSTTPSLRPVLALEFEKNIGPDYRPVFMGNLDYSIEGGSATGPNPFSLRISFDEPFLFDPRNGGLLVEFWVRSRATTALLTDATRVSGSTAFGLEGNMANSFGDVDFPIALELVHNPIPEPTPFAILGLGMIAFRIFRR